MLREISPRRNDIARNLRAQLIGAGKLPFVTEPCVEPSLHPPSGNLFVEPE